MKFLEKYFDGMKMRELRRIDEISHYNFNYFIGIGSDLLFASSNDDDITEWYLIIGKDSYFIGNSYTSSGDILERLDKPYT